MNFRYEIRHKETGELVDNDGERLILAQDGQTIYMITNGWNMDSIEEVPKEQYIVKLIIE